MSVKQFSSLYQTTILELNKRPKNYGKIENPSVTLVGQNKMCGDYVNLYLIMDLQPGDVERRIVNITFEGEGCAILKASASLMTELLIGKSIPEAQQLFHDFMRLTSGELDFSAHLNQSNIFAGISDYQSRLQCARLPWETLCKGLVQCQ